MATHRGKRCGRHRSASFREVESEDAARGIAPRLSIRRALVTRRRPFERSDVSGICLICTRL
ncbi:hypothetical protein OH687_23150 [Burkholderia anthina]|nr:hypothetical protein OH687_23150 [Burkholderia anthina]